MVLRRCCYLGRLRDLEEAQPCWWKCVTGGGLWGLASPQFSPCIPTFSWRCHLLAPCVADTPVPCSPASLLRCQLKAKTAIHTFETQIFVWLLWHFKDRLRNITCLSWDQSPWWLSHRLWNQIWAVTQLTENYLAAVSISSTAQFLYLLFIALLWELRAFGCGQHSGKWLAHMVIILAMQYNI